MFASNVPQTLFGSICLTKTRFLVPSGKERFPFLPSLFLIPALSATHQKYPTPYDSWGNSKTSSRFFFPRQFENGAISTELTRVRTFYMYHYLVPKQNSCSGPRTFPTIVPRGRYFKKCFSSDGYLKILRCKQELLKSKVYHLKRNADFLTWPGQFCRIVQRIPLSDERQWCEWRRTPWRKLGFQCQWK